MNFTNIICYAEFRCHYHNIDAVQDNGVQRSESTSLSKWTKALYMTANFAGGIFTNVLLELVLLIRAQMMTRPSGGISSCIKCLKRFIIVQLVVFFFFTGWAAYSFHRLIDKEVLGVIGGITKDSHIGDAKEGGNRSQQFSLFAGFCGVIHVWTSIVLVTIFTCSWCYADVPEEHTAMERRRALHKATCASMVAVASTLVCYGNIGMPYANAYHLLALDSIVNDLCLAFVSFSDSTELATSAGQVQVLERDVKPATLGVPQNTWASSMDEGKQARYAV